MVLKNTCTSSSLKSFSRFKFNKFSGLIQHSQIISENIETDVGLQLTTRLQDENLSFPILDDPVFAKSQPTFYFDHLVMNYNNQCM